MNFKLINLLFIEFYLNINPLLDEQLYLISGAVAAIVRGFLFAAAVPIFAADSSALPVILKIFVPTFFAAFPRCLKKSPNPSAAKV